LGRFEFEFITYYTVRLGLGTHSLVKAPRLGDSEVTPLVLESSCHPLPPV